MKSQEQISPPTWFVRHEGLVTGPHSESRIRQLLLEGRLTHADKISLDKRSWQGILQVPSVVPLQMRAEAGDQAALERVASRKQQIAEERERIHRIPFVPLLVVLLLVGTILVVSLLSGLPETEGLSQCDALPAPGVNWHNCRFLDLDVGNGSLRGANLNSSVLPQAELYATDLTEADLSYADLQRANLRYARLRSALLIGANLQHADLRDADLRQADLRFADFTASRMKGALLEGARLDNAIWLEGNTCGPNSVGRCRLGE